MEFNVVLAVLRRTSLFCLSVVGKRTHDSLINSIIIIIIAVRMGLLRCKIYSTFCHHVISYDLLPPHANMGSTM